MKIYTKTGDKGTTSLADGSRVHKDDPRVEAYGTVDELTATAAYMRDLMGGESADLTIYKEDLYTVLNKLMNLGSIIAAGEPSERTPKLLESDVEFLERRIDEISATLKPLRRFTLPGGHPLVSWAHICRTVCRRAERATVAVEQAHFPDANCAIYLNRLSDYFYQLGRKLCEELGAEELYWEP